MGSQHPEAGNSLKLFTVLGSKATTLDKGSAVSYEVSQSPKEKPEGPTKGPT